jgi:IPT/TIG domain
VTEYLLQEAADLAAAGAAVDAAATDGWEVITSNTHPAGPPRIVTWLSRPGEPPPPVPNPTSCNPASGTTAGNIGTQVLGTDMTGATGATFGGNPMGSFSVTNDTTVIGTTPPHVAGVVDVVVTGPNGAGTLVGGYTYIQPATPASVTPNTGSEAGGDDVAIAGLGFTGATGVLFGPGNPATNVVVASNNSITCTTPPGTGAVTVTVQKPGGNGSLPNGYTYVP